MRDRLRLLGSIAYSKFFGSKVKLISDERFAKDTYGIRFGRKLDLNNPVTFNEHICAIKVREKEEDYWLYTDKYVVRDYVNKTIGNQYLNNVLGIYDEFDDIVFSSLPNRFAIKATHGSGYNVIVHDKDRFDICAAKAYFKKWLSTNYYLVGREKNYKLIKPRIMVDEFLVSRSGELDEAKIYCFNGKASLVSYNRYIDGDRYCDFYDGNWNHIPVTRCFPTSKLSSPDNRELLMQLAEKLSAPFDFIRVDLYNIDGRIIFSELTFHDGGGLLPFYPDEFDYTFGRLFYGEKK